MAVAHILRFLPGIRKAPLKIIFRGTKNNFLNVAALRRVGFLKFHFVWLNGSAEGAGRRLGA